MSARIASLSFCLFVVAGCKHEAVYPNSEEGARALVQALGSPGADYAKLSQALHASSADYGAVFVDGAGVKVEKYFVKWWSEPDRVLKPRPGYTEVRLVSATTEEVRAWTGAAATDFPGGYRRIGPQLKPGLRFYKWSFVKPGARDGISIDGLVHVNGHWVVFPKMYQAFPGGGGLSDIVTGKMIADLPAGAQSTLAPPVAPTAPITPAAPSTSASAGTAGAATSSGGASQRAPEKSKRPGNAPRAKAVSVSAGTPKVKGNLPPEIVSRIVHHSFGRFRLCYDKGLASNPRLEGRVAVKFVVDSSGTVSTAADGGSDLPDRGVVECVVRAFQGLAFPSPPGGSVSVLYPISFLPGH